MFSLRTLLSLSLLAVASAQQAGTLTPESHPKLTWKTCTAKGCWPVSGSVTLDANWRWTHSTKSATNCYSGNTWDTKFCPDPVSCASNCAVDGADYAGTYGITTNGNTLTQKFVTKGPYSTTIGSRVYLMDRTDKKYQLFKAKNKEFTFDVDVSKLPCGLNGALYFTQMDADGGSARFPANRAGARFGTGYCDAQCPHDIKFINGEANTLDWKRSANDPNAGKGRYGSCCAEMDLWEANAISTAFTPHPCTVARQTRCLGAQCGDGANRYGGVCDKDGCDFNSYRLGAANFYGPGKKVNTNTKFTVVTQFITSDGTDTGALSSIRRLYMQNGAVIKNSVTNVAGVTATSSLTANFCKQQKSVFGDTDSFTRKGGMAQMGRALDKGMVLVMSIWDDHDARMLWLDSRYPLNKPVSKPGVKRGTCAATSGAPKDVEEKHPHAQVMFSNIRFGAIGSTL